MSKETKISASWEKQETIYSDERLTLIVVSFLKFASVARFSIELYRLLVEDQPNIYSYLPCKSENPESIIHCLVQLYIFIIFRSADFEHNKQVSRRRSGRFSQINDGVHEERNPATILFEMFHKSAGDINDKYLFYMCFSSWANGTNRRKWNCRRISYWNRWVNKLWNRELCVWENLCLITVSRWQRALKNILCAPRFRQITYWSCVNF